MARTTAERPAFTQFAHFALAGAAALIIVAAATAVASRRIGEREAIAEVRTTTLIKAEGVVRPLATKGLLDGDERARANAAEVLRRSVLDGSLVRVKLWREDGTIVFSDQPQLIGARYTLGEDEREALQTGAIVAESSDLTEPENRFERPFGRLLEVYLPIRAQTGERLLFEAYYRATIVDESGRRLWRSFAPITLGALLVLQLVQLPLAWSLAKRLQARLREREQLLGRALQASEVERRQIAGDLHDGAVQELTGVAYALSAAGLRGEADAELLTSSADSIRNSIKELRSLIVDIYPPNFAESSLESALADLLARAEERGLRTALRVDADGARISDPVARLLYRGAQEGVRNTLQHARATTVSVDVGVSDGHAVLEVVDDGRGLGDEVEQRRAAGHVGLITLRGLVEDAGGSVDVTAHEPAGTRLRVTVPV